MEVTIRVPTGAERVTVLGSGERNLKILREALGVNVTAREGSVHLRGEAAGVEAARRVLHRLGEAAAEGREIGRRDVLEMVASASGEHEGGGTGVNGWAAAGPGAWDGHLNVYAAGRPIRPKTPNQQRYVDAIRDRDLVFAVGPAGTGKTYLAVASAVHLLKSGLVKKVILARPAVEAGERLGFLPGDLRAKVNPYLRPLFDALHDMMDFTTLRRFMENDVVEVSPLAFMRGRTLNQAFVILDEAQNATRGQMKMFLTRLGHGSKMVVTGDITQSDLPEGEPSGLVEAMRRLSKTPGVGFASFDRADVVRHALVQRIIDAYGEEEEGERPRPRKGGSRGA